MASSLWKGKEENCQPEKTPHLSRCTYRRPVFLLQGTFAPRSTFSGWSRAGFAVAPGKLSSLVWAEITLDEAGEAAGRTAGLSHHPYFTCELLFLCKCSGLAL